MFQRSSLRINLILLIISMAVSLTAVGQKNKKQLELERIEKIIQNNNSLLVDQQYASVFLKIGYYFDEESIGIFNYKQNKSSKLNLKYEDELAKISREILNKNENKLQLMNVINLRHVLSLGSLSLMGTSKKNTQLLLEELKDLNKKN